MRAKRQNFIVESITRNIISLSLFLIMLVLIISSVMSVRGTSKTEALKIAEDSIRRSVMTCYAQEGSYPESIEYLKENYGLYVSDSYIVYYEAIGANLMPDITVYEK